MRSYKERRPRFRHWRMLSSFGRGINYAALHRSNRDHFLYDAI